MSADSDGFLADIFSRVDDQLAVQNEILKDIEAQMSAVEEQTEAQTRALGDILPGSIDIQEGNFKVIELSKIVSAGVSTDEPETNRRSIPFEGWIRSVIAGWPDGTNNLAGLGIDVLNVDDSLKAEVFPSNEEDDYVAANDFTSTFSVTQQVDQQDTIRARFVNNDQNNSHFINAIVIVEEDV